MSSSTYTLPTLSTTYYFSQRFYIEQLFGMPEWVHVKSFQFLKISICSFNVLSWLKCKNWFENKPTRAEIFAKIFLNMLCQTNPLVNNVFSQIKWPREGRFSIQHLCSNHEIETVVLSTIKGGNGEK